MRMQHFWSNQSTKAVFTISSSGLDSSWGPKESEDTSVAISSSVLSNHVGHDWILLLFLTFWHISSSSWSSAEWLHIFALPVMERFVSSERPSLAVCSGTQMSYNESGSSPAVFTLYRIWINSFRVPISCSSLCLILFPWEKADTKSILQCSRCFRKQKGEHGRGKHGRGASPPDCLPPVTSRIYPVQSSGRDQSVHLPVPHSVSTPPPKPQSAKMWCLSKNHHVFSLRKRNAWRHLPRCYHQVKCDPRPNERQTYWRTHFLHKVHIWWAIFPCDWKNTPWFTAWGPSAHHGLSAHALLQKHPREQPTLEWELLAAAAVAFLMSSFDCSLAWRKFRNAKFRSCFA